MVEDRDRDRADIRSLSDRADERDIMADARDEKISQLQHDAEVKNANLRAIEEALLAAEKKGMANERKLAIADGRIADLEKKVSDQTQIVVDGINAAAESILKKYLPKALWSVVRYIGGYILMGFIGLALMMFRHKIAEILQK